MTASRAASALCYYRGSVYGEHREHAVKQESIGVYNASQHAGVDGIVELEQLTPTAPALPRAA